MNAVWMRDLYSTERGFVGRGRMIKAKAFLKPLIKAYSISGDLDYLKSGDIVQI